MKTLFDDHTRAAIEARLDKLTPESKARWGKLTAPKMLMHLIVSFQPAFAERPIVVTKSFLSTGLGQWLIIDFPMPWPKNLPSSPGSPVLAPGDFAVDKARVVAYIARFAQGPDQTWGSSPAFGTLTPRQWAKLNYRHLHHHLTQFGV